MKIILLGSGNVATHLATAIVMSENELLQVYSKTYDHAKALVDQLNCGAEALDNLNLIDPSADLYLFAVSDNALSELAEKMPETSGVWAHTAGSVSINVLKKHNDHGIFYPLQTFSKSRKLDYASLPLYLDAATDKARETLTKLANSISKSVAFADDNQRKQLHLAAVFACNFTNHLYAIAEHLLSKANLSAEALAPLIKETSEKIAVMPAYKAQTGPAARKDTQTIKKHMDLLDEENLKKVYQTMSDSIIHSKLQTNRE